MSKEKENEKIEKDRKRKKTEHILFILIDPNRTRIELKIIVTVIHFLICFFFPFNNDFILCFHYE